MKLVVSVFWICCTAEKRDQMSPIWRFSNHSTGKRIRCAKTFASHCRFSVADSTSTAQERMAAVPAWISTSRAKPMPSVASRSRSALTSTSSTTHCIRKGLSSMKASSASANAKICASERFRPVMRPSICRGETCCFSTRGTKSAAGVNSSTTPVKWRDTCSSFSRRRPCAGSWIVAMPRLTPTSTTKWFMSQCRMHGMFELGQVFDLGAQRPGVQIQVLGHAHQIEQVQPLQRQREALSQRGQVRAVAMRSGHHRQAGQPALGAFGLQDHRHAA